MVKKTQDPRITALLDESEQSYLEFEKGYSRLRRAFNRLEKIKKRMARLKRKLEDIMSDVSPAAAQVVAQKGTNHVER